MADFDPNLAFRTGLLNGSGGGGGSGGASPQGGDGLANQVESPEVIFKGADKLLATGAKLAGEWAPIPINFGEVSMFTGLETQQGNDFASKKINQAAANMGMRGGPLYNTLVALIKDGSIKDHMTNPMAGGGDGGFLGSAEFASAANNFDSNISSPMDIGGSGNFAALGDLPPPLPSDAMAISAPSRGSGAEIA